MRHTEAIPTLLLVASAMTTAHASDVRVEAGVGYSRFGIVPNGTWYQLGVDGNRVQRESPSWLLGVTGNVVQLGAYGVDYHADYLQLGVTRAACECTTIDADYDVLTHALEPDAPRAYYSGTGRTQGLRLVLSPHVDIGVYRLSVNLGRFYYQQSWHETVYAWHGEQGAPTLAPFTLNAPTPLRHTLTYGVALAHGAWSLSYDVYRTPTPLTRINIPPLSTYAQTLTLSYVF